MHLHKCTIFITKDTVGDVVTKLTEKLNNTTSEPRKTSGAVRLRQDLVSDVRSGKLSYHIMYPALINHTYKDTELNKSENRMCIEEEF